MRKILFTDLDGTLLKNDKTISAKNKEAIGRMLAAGHCLVAATGRAVPGGLAVIEKLGLTGPGCYLIAYNGAVIFDCNENRIMEESTVPIADVSYLFAEAKRYGLHIQTYSDTHVLAEAYDKELAYYVRTTSCDYRLVPDVPAALEKAPHKVLLAELEDRSRLMRFEADHKEWAREHATSVFSCPEYLEYCPLHTDKGSGITFLRDYLKIQKEDTYAVGDERNDIPMLLAAGCGIAVENATARVKAAADYVTERNNEQDAIAEIIEKFILD